MSKFLVDEDVNQKTVRIIPADEKGFDILYPEEGSYKGASDPSVKKIAGTQGRVLVTCDKNFARFQLQPNQFPYGALWLRPKRTAQKRLKELLGRFCSFLLSSDPDSPYQFDRKIYEIHEDHVVITTDKGTETLWFADQD